MCYKSPGPRCASSTRKQKHQARLDRDAYANKIRQRGDISVYAQEKLKKFDKKYLKAVRAHDATKGGLEELAYAMDTATTQREMNELQPRYDAGMARRQKALENYAKKEDFLTAQKDLRTVYGLSESFPDDDSKQSDHAKAKKKVYRAAKVWYATKPGRVDLEDQMQKALDSGDYQSTERLSSYL